MSSLLKMLDDATLNVCECCGRDLTHGRHHPDCALATDMANEGDAE